MTIQELAKQYINARSEQDLSKITDYIQANELNCSQAATEDGKLLIDLAVQRLCTYFQKTNLNPELIHHELFLISLIFSRSIQSTPEHPSSKKALEEMQTIYAKIANKIRDDYVNLDFNRLTHTEQILYATFHAYDEILKGKEKAAGFIAAVNGISIETLKEKIKHKVIVIGEAHTDPGTLTFLRNVYKPLGERGYDTLGFETFRIADTKQQYRDLLVLLQKGLVRSTVTSKNTMDLMLFALQSKFKHALIDPRPYTKSSTKEATIHALVDLFFGKAYDLEICDLGMVYGALKAAHDNEGRVIILVGAMHAYKIITFLNKIGIETVNVVPFTDPKIYKLSGNQKDGYSYEGNTDREEIAFFKLKKPLLLPVTPESLEISLKLFFAAVDKPAVAEEAAAPSTAAKFKPGFGS